jgi:hypothetical protein
MAWLETCQIDAGKQVKHLSKQGMSTRQAIKKLSAESGIPENTINNWIYARSASKRIDMFDFVIDTLRNQSISDGWPDDLVQRVYGKGENLVQWGILWVCLEDKYVRGWYRAAFEKHGKTAKITDMLRTGKVWCTCPNCDGKVRQRGKPHASMNPALFTRTGYVNFNAIREAEV